MILTFPSLECLIYAVMFFLQSFTKHWSRNFDIARTASTCNEFRTSPKALINKAQNQGDNTVALKRTISKYFNCHSEMFQQIILFLVN